MEIIRPPALPGREWTWAYAGDLSQVVNFILSLPGSQRDHTGCNCSDLMR